MATLNQPVETRAGSPGGELGLVIMLKPRAEAWEVVEQAVAASVHERTAKDFIDLLELVGVLEWLAPAEPGHLSEDDSWRSLLIWLHRDLELERHIWRGREGWTYVLMFVLEGQAETELARWRGLIQKMIRKFF